MSSADKDPEFEHVVDAAARSWLRDHEGSMGDHPDVETLIAYQEGDLGDEASEATRQHLVVCADCFEEMKALERFDAAESVDPGNEVAESASWRTFTEWREMEMDRSAKSGRSLPSSWTLLAAAAVLLTLVGLSLLPRLALNAPGGAPAYAFDLLPDGSSLQREAESNTLVRIPEGVDALVATLNLGDQRPFDRYEIMLEAASGETLVRGSNAVPDEQGRFSLIIPRRQAPTGSYRIALSGWAAGQRSEIATYSFRLVDAN
ncbi:MAG: hypothetical protein AAGC60_05510 [Acidobacteriota bacterium]